MGGITMGSISYLKTKQLDEDNPNGISIDQVDERDKLNKTARVGDIMMGVGAAGVVAGTILLLVYQKKNVIKLLHR